MRVRVLAVLLNPFPSFVIYEKISYASIYLNSELVFM